MPKKTIEEIAEETVSDILERQEDEYIDDEEEIESNKAVEFQSTGITILDLIFGGGNPWGRIINIVGDNSSGKTLLACEMLFAAYKALGDKLEWDYDDGEAGFNFDTKAIWGFDILRNRVGSETVEEFEARLKKRLKDLPEGKRLIYVLDALDALTTDEEKKYREEKLKAATKKVKAVDEDEDLPEIKEKEKKGKGTYGTAKAKELGAMFRGIRKILREKNSILIVVSQVRENIGLNSMYVPYVRAGGKALDFYAAIILWLAEVEKVGKKGREIGIVTKARTSKNKVGKPFRFGYINILFDYGVDNIKTNIDFLCDLRTPTGKETEKKVELSFKGEKFETVEKFISYIEDRGKEKALASEVIHKWNEIEEEISSKDRKKRF